MEPSMGPAPAWAWIGVGLLDLFWLIIALLYWK